MKLPLKAIFQLLILYILSSCTVLNNAYFDDAQALEPGENMIALGAASGLSPVAEDVDNDGNITFSGDVAWAPSFVFTSQFGVWDKLNIRLAAHLGYGVSCIGVRGGVQYSLFSKESKFNAAIGADIGFVHSWDTIVWSAVEKETDGAWNYDFFIPLSYSINENTRIVLSPRYSYTTIYVRRTIDDPESWTYRPRLPVLSLGLHTKKVYLEVSGTYYKKSIYPNIGIVFPMGGGD